MKINIDEENTWENSSVRASQLGRSNLNELKTHGTSSTYVKALLSNLPKPSNNYEIDIMDSVEPEKEEDDEPTPIIEDEEERLIKLKKEKERREREEFLNQSTVIRRKLIRPVEVNKDYITYDERQLKSDISNNINNTNQIEEENKDIRFLCEEYIKNEMMRLLQHDSVNYPVKGNKVYYNYIKSFNYKINN